MTTQNGATRTLTTSIIVAVAAATFVAATAIALAPNRSSGDRSPATIESLAFNAVLEGTVTKAPEGSRFDAYQEWDVRIETVLYDRGPYMSNAYGKMVKQAVPVPTDTISIAVLKTIDLEVGGTYAFYASRSYFPEPREQAEWPWQSDLVLDATDNYRAATGTSEALIWSLDQVRIGSEAPVEAVISFATEYAQFLDQRNQGSDPAFGPRLSALAGEPSEGANGVARWLTLMSQRPVEDRQLPTDEMDLNEFQDAGIETAFSVTDWTPWLVVLLLDEHARGSTQWFGMYIEGAGFLGPVGVEAGDTVVELVGYGPRTGNIHLLRWAEGTPAEILADESKVSGAVYAVRGAALASIDAASNSEDRGTNDVLLVVDLRGGKTTVELTSLTDANRILIEILGESEPRSEPTPTKP